MEKSTLGFFSTKLIFWFVFLIFSTYFLYCVTYVSIERTNTLIRNNTAPRVYRVEKNENNCDNDNDTSKNVTTTHINIHFNKVVHLDSKCDGKYIYMHNLPSEFNEGVLKNCETSLSPWLDMCPYVSNMGLGQEVDGKHFKHSGWFKTFQFSLEVIFHNRMRHYKCLTDDSSLASAVFVPFYAGFELGGHLWGFNTSVRDHLSLKLVEWLRDRPEWGRMLGRDHFFASGRIAWDFKRITDDESDWGNKLLLLPETNNMTMLTIETTLASNQFAIPYPTYFHPSTDEEVFAWQRRMRAVKRPHLFSFAGAPRPGMESSIRGQLIKQCESSGKLCKLLDCRGGKCDDPSSVMGVLERSVFCLQPAGDSFTRRSIFDSILAGCVPVFFHQDSGYTQYLWHFPRNHTKYSVFIPESEVKEKRVSIGETLRRIPKRRVEAMREEVIEMIPRVIYAHPKSRLEAFEDAFDVTVKKVLERVEKLRIMEK